MFARLVASQTTVSRFRDIYIEITFLERGMNSDAFEIVRDDWELQFKSEEEEISRTFREQLSSKSSIATMANPVNPVSLQVRSVQAQDDASSKKWRELLIESAMILLKASNMPIPTVPQ